MLPQPPAPPPPPPAPSIISGLGSNFISNKNPEKQIGATVIEDVNKSLNTESLKAVDSFLHFKRLSEEESNKFIFICSYKPVVPVIQSGPLCGMVALAMASELYGNKRVPTEEILSHAQNLGYSKQGEIFSVHSMQDLAQHFLDCPSEVQQLNSDSLSDVVTSLAHGKLLLMPYDADKNHGPCLRKGHKAHWTLITGFFIAVENDMKQEMPSWIEEVCKPDAKLSNLRYWCACTSATDENAMLKLCRPDNTFVFAHQGKSKHTGLWLLSDLLYSNSNLVEVGPDRCQEEFVLPEGGVAQGLCSKCVLLDKIS